MDKRKVAYFGTQGNAGHYAVPICGNFTRDELREIEHIDCDNFDKVFNTKEFKIAKFGRYTIFGFPASPDDKRGGSKTVILIDGEANKNDFIVLIENNPFLKNQFNKLSNIYNCRLFE